VSQLPLASRLLHLHAAALLALVLTAAAALVAPTAHAQSSTPSEQPLAHLQHTTWTLKDGMPGPVMAIAQTTDGYLWLGTGTGLFRFDGVRFERFETIAGERLPSRQVMALHATRDNALWVGLLDGGTALVRQGRVLHLDAANGLFDSSTRAFAEQRDGTLWVATGRALLKRKGEDKAWTAVGPASGYGGDTQELAINVKVDAQDNVWVVTQRTLYVQPSGSTRFAEAPLPRTGFSQLSIGPDGRAWGNDAADAKVGATRLPLPGEPLPATAQHYTVPNSYAYPLFDREGKLWFGALGGLMRTSPVGTPEQERQARQFINAERGQGLSGDQVIRIFQDRDGAIWVGTNGGLDRFRGAAVDGVDLPGRSSAVSMSAAPDGEIWFTSQDDVFVQPPDGGPARKLALADGPQSLTAVFVDRHQRRWLGGRNGLFRQEGDRDSVRFVAIPSPDGQPWVGAVRDIAEDGSGAIWITANRYSLQRYADGKLERMAGRDGFPKRPPESLATDTQGHLWLGYGDGSLLRHDGTRVTALTPTDGLKVGGIKVVAIKGPHVWIGGDTGVQLVSEPGRPLIRLDDPAALEGVSGLVETDAGDLWLNGANGITHLIGEEVRRAIADPAYRSKARRIDLLDGLRGRAEQSWPLHTALQTPDGKVWFSLTNGVVRIDPARLPSGEVAAPPVDIQRVSSGGEVLPASPDGPLRLAAGTRDLDIEYTAMSLAVPERTRFRYRLIGQDRDWQDAGTRRRAFYTNLGPGAYDFQVEASQDGGPWSVSPATLRFEIAPTLTQNAWFRAAAVLAGIAALGGLAALRARQSRLHEQDRLAARVQERERIARDLHDTLLQGVFGLILRFEAIARRLPGTERAAMERVLTDADSLLVEGRDRVTDLRLPPPDANQLEHTLEALGRELSHTHGAAFALTVDGTPRALAPALSASICLIAREAIFNAFQHAQAGRIEVTLHYDDARFALFIRDDGVGVPDDVQDRGGRPGHWGLSGMRERADLAGVSYRLTSQVGGGTEIELSATARQAYELAGESSARPAGGAWWRRLRRG
jgi:signal transduction histidine kinase/sugar lactone lactonase YvrE